MRNNEGIALTLNPIYIQPIETRRACSSTTIWSHWAAVERRCATKREVRPAARRCSALRICFSVRESSADVASSHSRMGASCRGQMM